MRHKTQFHTILTNEPFLEVSRDFKVDLQRYALCAVLVSFFTGCAAMAQSNYPTRFNIAASFNQSRPQEAFRAKAGDGLGGGGTFLYHLDHAGWVSARFDAAWMQYGKEKKRVPLSE